MTLNQWMLVPSVSLMAVAENRIRIVGQNCRHFGLGGRSAGHQLGHVVASKGMTKVLPLILHGLHAHAALRHTSHPFAYALLSR